MVTGPRVVRRSVAIHGLGRCAGRRARYVLREVGDWSARCLGHLLPGRQNSVAKNEPRFASVAVGTLRRSHLAAPSGLKRDGPRPRRRADTFPTKAASTGGTSGPLRYSPRSTTKPTTERNDTSRHPLTRTPKPATLCLREPVPDADESASTRVSGHESESRVRARAVVS